MSMREIVEIAVQLDRFKNIDLPQQGLYQLRATIYYNSEDESKVPYLHKP